MWMGSVLSYVNCHSGPWSADTSPADRAGWVTPGQGMLGD